MTLPDTKNFVASFSYDIRLAPYDIEGSIAHAQMLAKQGIIPQKDCKKIIRGLKAILKDLSKGWRLPFDEDIHFAIERELIHRVGRAGQRLHTGRSRNDQVATDLRLYLKDQIELIISEIIRLERAILKIAQINLDAIMPGFTHLQHAQPILFSHHVLAYAWMLERDRSRFADTLKRADILPLGSAALGGTSFPIDRHYAAKLLGFKHLSENSLDATASRDIAIEFLSDCAILMSNLSRFAEEMIIWSSPEFSFIDLAEEFTTGSSIMPQKRNPDVAEIVRGETGRVYGSLVSLLTIVKGLPLGYNRDLQEDKPPVFDATDTVIGSLSVMAPMVESMKVHKKIMKRWCDYGFIGATELADFLTKREVPFREAHGIVRKIVNHCQRHGLKFEDLSLAELKRFNSKFDKNVLAILTPEKVVRAKTSYGGTSPKSVLRQIDKLRRALSR